MREDGGQLLLLAGIVLVTAFVFTAFTLAQLADLKRSASDELDARLIDDFRFTRSKIGTTLGDSLQTSTDNATFRDILNTTVTNLKVVSNDKGYDLIVHLASRARGLEWDEWNFTRSGYKYNFSERYTQNPPVGEDGAFNLTVPYHFHSHDNYVDLEWANGGDRRDWDGLNDGIVWVSPCNLNTAYGTYATGCIRAAVIYIYLADESSSIEEFVVYSFNTDADL